MTTPRKKMPINTACSEAVNEYIKNFHQYDYAKILEFLVSNSGIEDIFYVMPYPGLVILGNIQQEFVSGSTQDIEMVNLQKLFKKKSNSIVDAISNEKICLGVIPIRQNESSARIGLELSSEDHYFGYILSPSDKRIYIFDSVNNKYCDIAHDIKLILSSIFPNYSFYQVESEYSFQTCTPEYTFDIFCHTWVLNFFHLFIALSKNNINVKKNKPAFNYKNIPKVLLEIANIANRNPLVNQAYIKNYMYWVSNNIFLEKSSKLSQYLEYIEYKNCLFKKIEDTSFINWSLLL